MTGVVAAGDAVAVGEALDPVGIDEHRAEGLVTRRERLGGEVDAAAQVTTVVGGEGGGCVHAPTTAHPCPRRDVAGRRSGAL